MAKRLGFRPEGLIRNRPGPRQKWKLPVKDWIRELHRERFGCVLGENSSLPTVQALPIKYSEEEARIYGEERYREEYCEAGMSPDRGSPNRPGENQQAMPEQTP